MIDKVKIAYWDRTAYKITDPEMFGTPIHSIGYHWHVYNTDAAKKATGYYPQVVLKRFLSPTSSNIPVQVLDIVQSPRSRRAS